MEKEGFHKAARTYPHAIYYSSLPISKYQEKTTRGSALI